MEVKKVPMFGKFGFWICVVVFCICVFVEGGLSCDSRQDYNSAHNEEIVTIRNQLRNYYFFEGIYGNRFEYRYVDVEVGHEEYFLNFFRTGSLLRRVALGESEEEERVLAFEVLFSRNEDSNSLETRYRYRRVLNRIRAGEDISAGDLQGLRADNEFAIRFFRTDLDSTWRFIHNPQLINRYPNTKIQHNNRPRYKWKRLLFWGLHTPYILFSMILFCSFVFDLKRKGDKFLVILLPERSFDYIFLAPTLIIYNLLIGMVSLKIWLFKLYLRAIFYFFPPSEKPEEVINNSGEEPYRNTRTKIPPEKELRRTVFWRKLYNWATV